VFNVIVDQLQVEQKLLFEKDDEARAVMREKVYLGKIGLKNLT